jgi:hypothetical protein
MNKALSLARATMQFAHSRESAQPHRSRSLLITQSKCKKSVDNSGHTPQYLEAVTLLIGMSAAMVGKNSCVTRENRSGGNDASKEKGSKKEKTLRRERTSRKSF